MGCNVQVNLPPETVDRIINTLIDRLEDGIRLGTFCIRKKHLSKQIRVKAEYKRRSK